MIPGRRIPVDEGEFSFLHPLSGYLKALGERVDSLNRFLPV